MLKRKHDHYVDIVKRSLIEDALELANLRREQLDKKLKELERQLEELEKSNKKKVKKIKKLKKRLKKVK